MGCRYIHAPCSPQYIPYALVLSWPYSPCISGNSRFIFMPLGTEGRVYSCSHSPWSRHIDVAGVLRTMKPIGDEHVSCSLEQKCCQVGDIGQDSDETWPWITSSLRSIVYGRRHYSIPCSDYEVEPSVALDQNSHWNQGLGLSAVWASSPRSY